MQKATILFGLFFVGSVLSLSSLFGANEFRPPAVPLITWDPYMNIWSMTDNLYDDYPKLWDGTIKALFGFIRIDGTTYRFMGVETDGEQPIPQISVNVYPTRTVYVFATSTVQLNVEFITPAFSNVSDLDTLSLPITYIHFEVTSLDNQPHSIQIYYDNTGEIAVNAVNEEIEWSHFTSGNIRVMTMGTTAQNYFGVTGDRVGIDWGHVYVACDEDPTLTQSIYGSVAIRNQFIQTGTIPSNDDENQPRQVQQNWPVMAVMWDFGTVTGKDYRVLTFAYDEVWAVDYFGLYMPPYWRRNGQNATDLLQFASKNYENLRQQCITFDANLITELNKEGNNMNYTIIASLAYRQAFAGTKLVWNPEKKAPWYFLKEISSDGDLSTVDVIFPASPVIIWQSPLLMNMMVVPLLAYANNETWVRYNLTWAPHHLGYYPVGNLEPWQQEQMPVEETGNLLLLIATAAQKLGNKIDSSIYPHYWDLLISWADYLITVLPDPGNQLCTDDFEGPSPHNVNLAAKGIVALDAFAYLCKITGNITGAQYYNSMATKYAQYWVQKANDGNHFRLQYNLPNTWSQKYNIYYETIIGLSTFSDSVISEEIDYYLSSHYNTYGIPLDNRATFTKLDWSSWIAAMGTQEQFNAIMNAIYKFANETPDRVPLTDWYDTIAGTQTGFQARPVVGGVFAKML